jgi:hypothetical protein
LISANASQQEPAKFIACFVCDGNKPLLLPIASQHYYAGDEIDVEDHRPAVA